MGIVGVVTCSVSTTEENASDGIDIRDMEFVEISFGVDEDGALVGLSCGDIVSNAVVWEVVEYFQSEEETRGRIVSIPVEYRPVDDGYFVFVCAGRGVLVHRTTLKGSQRWGDLNDSELCPGIYLGVCIPDIVEDIEHQGTVAGTQFVDDEIVIWILRQLVVGNQISSYSVSIIRPKELCRCMP